MGREVRRVPPHWSHPKTVRHYGQQPSNQPMYDQNFADAAAEWKAGLAAWETGERPSYCDEDGAKLEYWEWDVGPPDRAYYRPWRDDEATWFQVWETVSEGTPVTPPFATTEELVEHLVARGDEWDQKRGRGGWDREAARSFVGIGWAPSLIATAGRVFEARDGAPL